MSAFDSVLGIQRDGSVVVVEHFTPAAASGHIVWSTPTEYPGTWSIHRPRVVEILQVTTAEGRSLTYSERRRDGRLELDINRPGTEEVRLVYAVRNAIDFQADHDRLLWHPGEGWRGDASNVTLFVQVPPEVVSSFNAQAYLRGHGLLPVRESSAGPDRIWFQVPDLSAGDDLVIDVALPSGAIQEPPLTQRVAWFIRANTIVFLPLVVLVVMLVLRTIKSIPEEDSASIVPRYDPPARLTPAEVGLLVDDSLDPRDVTGTIIDLAVRKYVRLEQCTPDEGVEFTGQDFILRLLRPMEDWKELQPHEQTVLFHTFYGGEWTKLSSLTLRFYAVVPVLRAQLCARLRLRGFYWVDPERAPLLRLFNVGVLCGILYLFQVFGVFRFAESWLLSALAIAASALIVHFLGRHLTAKTLKGMRAYRDIRGFREFLDSVERDRLERLPADLFERCLPYAMALGVEHHWADAFSGMAVGPPDWFNSDRPELFNTARLARVLDLFSTQTRQTLVATPRGKAAKA
ncbi:MAG: DUF2207 domain-containing protein [Terriglobales bacterium]